MNTLDFLQRVLPSEGHYAAIVINGGAPQQAFFDTVDKLATACLKSDSLGNNIYYAYSSFQTRGNRKQDNVLKTKVLAIDVDCVDDDKHTYKNQKDGLTALLKFVQGMSLPKPLIVSSGRGLHVYWVLEEALPPMDWKPLADGLKAAALQNNFDIDPTITGDSARVLRPIGTHNPKNGAEVKVLVDAPATTRATLENLLSGYMTIHALPQQVPSQRPSTGSKLLDALAVTSEFPPAVPHVVKKKCAQIEWCVDNPDKVEEPLWYSLIGVAAHCQDPEDTAVLWSQGHPQFNEFDTRRKVQQWKANATGPSTCAKFKEHRPNGCAKCKFAGRINTPARISVSYDKATGAFVAPDKVANEIPMPPMYSRTKNNTIVQTIEETDIEVSPFLIYPVGYGRDESLGYETVRFKWDRQHAGWSDLTMRQAYLADGSREFPTALADQGIVLPTKAQTETFQHMLRSYMDELRKAKAMTNLYATMGWKEKSTQFVIGDHLIRRKPDGSVVTEDISIASASNRLASELYTKKGDLNAWVKATTLLQSANMPWHQFALLLGFAAPLMKYTGLNGVMVSLDGPTGAGKSLIQLWQQSIFGDPDKLHFAAKYTQNALFARLGMYSNLPMTIDEATIMQNCDVGELCYLVSQGRDKARLNRNSSEREAKTWETIVTVSTNGSLAAKMQASGMETDAQLARLLELKIPAHSLFAKSSDAGRKIHMLITGNHGVAGHPYLEVLLKYTEEELKMMVVEAIATFSKRYGVAFAGHERFWEVAIALVDLGGRLAYENGLVGFPPEEGIGWVLSQLSANRQGIEDNKRTWDELLSEYLSEEVADEILVVMHTKGGKPTVDHSRVPRGSVMARFDKYRPSAIEGFDRGTLLLVRPAFKRWLSARGYDYNSYKRESMEAGADATPASKKTWIGKDTELQKLGQPYVLGFNLNHPALTGFFDIGEENPEDLTLGKMAVVDNDA